MREHDQPKRPARFRVWIGFILLATLLRGLAAAADDPRPGVNALAEPIELAADRVIVWDAPDGRWAVLSGGASALQGDRGATATAIVVRITAHAVESRTGATVYQAELYAEGDVLASSSNETEPRKTGRFILQSAEAVNIAPDVDDVVRLEARPKGIELVERAAFPAAAPAVDPPPAPLAQEVVEQAKPANESPSASRRMITDPEVVEAQAIVQDGGEQSAPVDRSVMQVQDGGRSLEDDDIDLPPLESDPGAMIPDFDDAFDPSPTPTPELDLLPLPGDIESEPAPPLRADPRRQMEDEFEYEDEAEIDDLDAGDPLAAPPMFVAPVEPGSQRVFWIWPRSGRPMDVQNYHSDGTHTITVRGGVNVVAVTPQYGTVDIEAESAVIWRHPNPKAGEAVIGSQGERIENPTQPMEIYLEGNVIFRQDEMQYAGRADQRTFRAAKLYYDFVSDKIMAVEAQADVFAKDLISPMKLKAPRIEQFHAVVRQPDGTLAISKHPEIRADRTVSTGSRFPDPAYKIYNRSITLTRRDNPAVDPNTGKVVAGREGAGADDTVWRFDARTNLFYMGPVPVFYWPRFTGEADDLDPPLRMIGFRANNYFGQQVLTDWNGFKVFGLRRPAQIDNWNIDVDYLSARTKTFPALGSELGWFGSDLINDVLDPYHRNPSLEPSATRDYFGYFDIWGLKDEGIDFLGTGPAIVTNGPPGAGSRGYQRTGVPPFQDIRGRLNLRHMQRFLPDDDEHRFEDMRLQVEAAYTSDRHFLEQYYKRLFDIGMDQETLVYGQWQKNNWAMTLHAEANLQDFLTDTQWLPKFDYYRLADTFFNNRLVYYQNSGVNYANTHTDVMVNNHNLFPLSVTGTERAFMPFDPISNTSGVFAAGRGYTSHELNLPMNFGDVIRVNPYVQGQAAGWTDQIGGGYFNQLNTGAQGRLWGAAGVHVESTAWKVYPGVENELLNIHGLNNKISFFGDFRTAYSNMRLNSLAVQDDLDDNTYEFVRRYFAITLWENGVLPYAYDPRHLMIRRTFSPISGPNDVQSSVDTIRFGIHQRLQTKRGPEGRRRIVDWMTLDAAATYFPNPSRDNIGKPWGQTTYNYQWFVGDRTSIISTGWFDFWELSGSRPQDNYLVGDFNPKGLNVITTGVSLSRPPRGNVFLGYSIIDTGMLKTSALNASISYWLSPKWYGTFSNSYDFGNKIPLGSQFSFTRIGADYLLSIGLAVDPQRDSYMFAFQISPRLAPTLRLGSGTGLNQFDSRLAPVQ